MLEDGEDLARRGHEEGVRAVGDAEVALVHLSSERVAVRLLGLALLEGLAHVVTDGAGGERDALLVLDEGRGRVGARDDAHLVHDVEA